MDIGLSSDVGRRQINEDSCGYAGGFFVVADGMGGAQAGEVASALAVQRLMRLSKIDEGFPDRLREAIDEANTAVLTLARSEDSYRGMGTTVAMVKIVGGMGFVAHVGDSRVYHWRGGELRLLTQDHSVVGELLRSGGITPDEALHHPHRHLLTQALGTEPSVQPELIELGLYPDDIFLLCTDGLTGVVEETRMAEILSEGGTAQETADRLVREACEAGAPDNISVIVVRVQEEAQ